MLEPVELAVGGATGLAALVMVGQFILKRVGTAVIEGKADAAKVEIIDDLRDEITRLQTITQALHTRVEALETKVGKLQDRLVTVRGHALVAYGIVQAMCTDDCPNANLGQIKEALTSIIKED